MTDTDITLTTEAWTVSATEKRQIRDYENIQAHAKLSGEIDGYADDPDAVKAELKPVQSMLTALVRRQAQERVDEATGGE